jgi:hypothetical protein
VMSKIYKWFLLLGLLLAPVSLQATCSGSGTIWSCTSATTIAQVNAVISSASDGATVTFANGSYSWTGSSPCPGSGCALRKFFKSMTVKP